MERINKMSGFEFEKLCQTLMLKMGFSVETTAQTGDGGIDLVAVSEQPFIKGKYIVQCKRYSNGVGEPIIRDLYGVVADQRANKGILITTGYFTISAIKFAQGKNIELIDGEELQKLLYDHGLLATENSVFDIKSFKNHTLFNLEKFSFYKSMIDQNLFTIEMGKDFLFSFMFDYFVLAEENLIEQMELLAAGFPQEYLSLFEWYTNKYYKKGKEQKELLPHYIRKYKGLALLYNFDLFEYVQNRYDVLTKRFFISLSYTHEYKDYQGNDASVKRKCNFVNITPEKKEEILPILWNTEKVQYITNGYLFYELMNLLSIFEYFSIEKGVNWIHKIMCNCHTEFMEYIKVVCSQHTGNMTIHIPTIKPVRYVKGKGKVQFDHIDIAYANSISLKPFFERYSDENAEKISCEIKKIRDLLDAIDLEL